MISGRPGATAENVLQGFAWVHGSHKNMFFARFEAVLTWGSETLEEMWRTRLHCVRNWEGAWLPEEESQVRGGFRVALLGHEQAGGRSGRTGTAPARKDSDGPSRVSWSNCLAATVTSTRKHQTAFRKVSLSPLTSSENCLANSGFLFRLWSLGMFPFLLANVWESIHELYHPSVHSQPT